MEPLILVGSTVREGKLNERCLDLIFRSRNSSLSWGRYLYTLTITQWLLYRYYVCRCYRISSGAYLCRAQLFTSCYRGCWKWRRWWSLPSRYYGRWRLTRNKLWLDYGLSMIVQWVLKEHFRINSEGGT